MSRPAIQTKQHALLGAVGVYDIIQRFADE